jgi:hypothetical protein
MDNDKIVESICLLENININDWYPVTEEGEDSDLEFDKRFSLDRTYFWQHNSFRKRIRFVKYYTNTDHIVINVSKLRISNIIKNSK